MISITSFSGIYILLYLISVCFAIEVGTFSLFVHSPVDSLSTLSELATIHINKTQGTITPELKVLQNEKNNLKMDHYCLSLMAESVDSSCNFPCFNYFEVLNENNVYGTIGIEITDTSDECIIEGVTFTPSNFKELEVKIIHSLKLADSKVRLSINENKRENIEFEKRKKEFDQVRREEQKEENDELERLEKRRNVVLDHGSTNNEFQEIILPKGIYADNRTFIERNWVFIIPPTVIVFIMGNLLIGS